MGSVFEITVIDSSNSAATEKITIVIAEITRIEHLISEWLPCTQVSEVNRNAGIKPVKVDRELFDLTQRAITYSFLSDGAFDISIAALDKVWVFDGSMTEVPDSNTIQQSITNVGYRYIQLDSSNSTIFLVRKGMKIGFGSIGKGYAADKGRNLLVQMGVTGGIVNASGDMATWGRQTNKQRWRIGISNPFKANKIIRTLKFGNGAVATSGSYQKYAEIDEMRYSHIINPQTGYPSTGLISVTIYGPSAEFANALSTSIMVLGKRKGMALLKKFRNYKGIFILDNGKVINGL